MFNRLEEMVGCSLADDLYAILKYDPKSRKIGQGSLAENTHVEIQEKVVEMLVQIYAISTKEAQTCTAEAWNSTQSSIISTQSVIKPIGNVESLFHTIKSHGIKIAVCTSDSRDVTLEALNYLKVLSLVDRVMCGDDLDNVPKPNPQNVHTICSELDVKPQNAVVIGR